MKINRKDQKPSALCSDQLRLLKFAFQSMVKLRRHLSIPGHQMMIPETHINITQAPPTALIRWPVLPDSKLSCRSTSHSTMRNPTCREFPRSAWPVHADRSGPCPKRTSEKRKSQE